MKELSKKISEFNLVYKTQYIEKHNAIYIVTEFVDHISDSISMVYLVQDGKHILTDDEYVLFEFLMRDKELYESTIKNYNDYGDIIKLAPKKSKYREITMELYSEPTEKDIFKFATFIRDVLVGNLTA